MIFCPLTRKLVTGEPRPITYVAPSPKEVADNARQWREVAARIVAGEFDHKGRKPTGSLAKSLRMGLRQDDPLVGQALRYLGRIEE